MSTTLLSARRELPGDVFLAPCAVSGGTLQGYIRLLMDQTGGKLCLRLEPVYMVFQLPCPDGKGQALTLDALRQRYDGQTCHFSEALCTEYFTELRDSRLHAVLFDSPDSLRRKLRTAEDLGVPLVLVEDPKLLKLLREKHPT